MIINIENIHNLTKNDINEISKAAIDIKKGNVVAFPTETVYGLGASLFNPEGINKVFKYKKRPADNPLIAHISNIEMVEKIVEFTSMKQKEIFYNLSRKFWPGPISFILKSKEKVPSIARGGLDTIAIRMPDNKIALELISIVNNPLVAPSANISGKPSCTDANHVYRDFGENINYIINGGDTTIGIESTVLDLTDITHPLILRPGFISDNEINQFFDEINYPYYSSYLLKKSNSIAKSPGMKYRHYKPEAKTILSPDIEKINLNNFFSLIKKAENPILILFYSDNDKILQIKEFCDTENIKFIYYTDIYKFSAGMYKNFRDADINGYKTIIIQKPDNKGIGYALNNRLYKACEEKL